MASDLFSGLSGLSSGLSSGLGGLVKGLSNLMPQDDPAVQLLNAQTELDGYQKQEQELYAQIGKSAVDSKGLEAFGQLGEKLALVQANIAAAQQKLSGAKAEQDAKKKAEDEAAAALTCPSCGHVNPTGTAFCGECGTKLGAPAKTFCTSCGAELAPGTKFCGACGAKQPGA